MRAYFSRALSSVILSSLRDSPNNIPYRFQNARDIVLDRKAREAHPRYNRNYVLDSPLVKESNGPPVSGVSEAEKEVRDGDESSKGKFSEVIRRMDDNGKAGLKVMIGFTLHLVTEKLKAMGLSDHLKEFETINPYKEAWKLQEMQSKKRKTETPSQD